MTGQISGSELERVLPLANAAARAADELGLPPAGSGYRRQFTIGQAITMLVINVFESDPRSGNKRRTIARVLPRLIDRKPSRYIGVVFDGHGGGKLKCVTEAEQLMPWVSTHISAGRVVHVVDVATAVATIESTIGRSIGWAA